MIKDIAEELVQKNLGVAKNYDILEKMIKAKEISIDKLNFYGRSYKKYLFDMFLFFSFISAIGYFHYIAGHNWAPIIISYVVGFFVFGIVFGVFTDFDEDVMTGYVILYFCWTRIFRRPIPILQEYIRFKNQIESKDPEKSSKAKAKILVEKFS